MTRALYISFLIILFSLSVKAQQTNLDSLVNLQLENVSLKEALNEISEQYDIRFSYSDSKIPVENTIQLNFSATRLEDVLRSILYDNEINFNIIGNQIVLFPFNSNQTIIIHGKVIDKSNGSPIPFANISLSGTHKGTSSNENGEFQLPLTKLPSELLISHLSHEKKLIYIYDDSEEIEISLVPAQTTLQEITISAKRNTKSNYQLIKKAYDVLSKSRSDMKYGKAFYRQKSQRENKYTEIFEMFYDIKYSANGIEDWAVQEGRYAFQTNEEYDIFLYNKNFTLLSRLFPIQQPETNSYIIPVNPNVKKLYDLDLIDVLKFDDRFIGVIAYTPKSTVNSPLAKGELFIDFETYQVLKMKGTLINEKLDIISFGDNESAWKNYKLDFQISFIDDQSGQLLMDYVQIDHQFDYYYKQKEIGKIKTSSLLTFYEHYSPVKNKKLGGAIDFVTSDMDLIDGIGYNSSFWSQNPIVKRTPLEEKLINDFERNEAFGMVFLNNKDEVVLLPDKQNTEAARQIITKFESKNPLESNQQLFLRLDNSNYQPDDNLRFTAYVVDKWTRKPTVIGSVLTVEIHDNSGHIVLQKKFDINEGTAYGELALTEMSNQGNYRLQSYTNTESNHIFEKEITITHNPIQSSQNAQNPLDDITQKIEIDFYPESGTLLSDTRSKIVFKAHSIDENPVNSTWVLVNNKGTVFQTIETNTLGIGAFEFVPAQETRYFLKSTNPGESQQWMIPYSENTGFCMKINDNKSKSIQIALNQKPVITKDVFLLFTSGGKVFSFYEKNLHEGTTLLDLPIAHLPGGIINLIAMNKTGNILGQRSFFVRPEKLDVRLESVTWKSRRNNRMRLKLNINDQNGRPINANLSAICSTASASECQQCDIRNYMYFGDATSFANIDLNYDNDSIYALVDNLLIIKDEAQQNLQHSVKSESKISTSQLANNHTIDEPITAEISISGNYGVNSIAKADKNKRKEGFKEFHSQLYWVPKLEIDEHGIALLDYQISKKNETIYVNIQGISHNGLVGYQTFEIDPYRIKAKKNK